MSLVTREQMKFVCRLSKSVTYLKRRKIPSEIVQSRVFGSIPIKKPCQFTYHGENIVVTNLFLFVCSYFGKIQLAIALPIVRGSPLLQKDIKDC